MPEKKNLCALVPIELHQKVTAAKTAAGLNINDYVSQVLAEYYEWKENGGANMARENGKERTLAFQISEDLFQRIKAHLERESRRLGNKVTQKDIVIGLIEAALTEAEQAETESVGSVEAAQGGDTERQDGAETDSAPEETTQEAPCEDGADAESGEASQPMENG